MSSNDSDAEPLVEDLVDEEAGRETGIRDATVLRHRNPIQLPVVSSTSSTSSSSRQHNNDARDGNNNPASGAGLGDKSQSVRGTRTVSSSERTRDEYISCLSHWNSCVNNWRAYQQTLSATMLASSLIAASTILPSTTGQTSGLSADDQNDGRTNDRTQGSQATAGVPSHGPEVRLYRIPKLWKRLTAEMIDFLFLLVIKIIVTFIAIEYFDVIDLSKFDFTLLDSIESGEGTSLTEDLDAALTDAYRLAFELTSEILVIESLHRIIVIVYETIFLMRSFFQRRSTAGTTALLSPGGATPGKFIMGLRVVSCSSVTEFLTESGESFVQVTPGRDIGFGWSLLRAMVKNFSSVFFLPASLTVLISRHNRAAYDIVCRSQVVEE